MDEAHYFVADSSFGGNTQEIFRNILRLSYFNIECYIRDRTAEFAGFQYGDYVSVPPIQRIYMTATPDYVEPIIAYEENTIRSLLCNLCDYIPEKSEGYSDEEFKKISDYCYSLKKLVIKNYLPSRIEGTIIPQKKRNINLRFFCTKEFLLREINSSPEDDKWLIFVSNKQDGANLKDKLGSKMCTFIYSDKKLLSGRKEIAINKSFDKKVLIATTVLDNGISIDDDLLKNIVIDTTDRVQLIQMLGRKRLKDGECINLYIRDKIEDDFERYLKHTEQILRNIKRSRHFTPDFENELIQKEFIGERYFSYDPRCGRHLANPYSDYYLGRKAIEYIKMKHKLHRNVNAFREQICEWLGIKYEVDNPAQMTPAAHDDDNDELITSIWKELEADIKPYADENRKISKEDTATLADKYITIFRISGIKHKSGINTRDGHHMSNLNALLKFFAEKGLDEYKLSGKENYTVKLINEGKKNATMPVKTAEEEAEPVDNSIEVLDDDYEYLEFLDEDYENDSQESSENDITEQDK